MVGLECLWWGWSVYGGVGVFMVGLECLWWGWSVYGGDYCGVCGGAGLLKIFGVFI